MKKTSIVIILLLIASNGFTQEKQNTILFPEGSLGIYKYQGYSGFSLSLSINYQNQKNLFSIRRRYLASITEANTYKNITRESKENSILYGRRHIKKGFSYSFSAGISKTYSNELNDVNTKFENISYIGIPLEFNIKWFKAKKAKIYMLGTFPLGEKTSLSFSSGFKLFGNISKKSYIGLSYTFGFGNYKNYQ